MLVIEMASLQPYYWVLPQLVWLLIQFTRIKSRVQKLHNTISMMLTARINRVFTTAITVHAHACEKNTRTMDGKRFIHVGV
jgi:hypothetical protein